MPLFKPKTIEMFMSMPNILSFFRIACIPPLIFFITRLNDNTYNRYILLLIILAAGVSDIFDGYLARKKNVSTLFGTYLDSIADKLLFLPACYLLSQAHIINEPRFPVWLFAIVAGKEIVLNIFAAIIVSFITGKSFRPSIFGKASTFLLVLTIIAVVINNFIPIELFNFVCVLTAVLISISIIHYTYIGLNPRLMTFNPKISKKSYG